MVQATIRGNIRYKVFAGNFYVNKKKMFVAGHYIKELDVYIEKSVVDENLNE